jgi:hypothetical protein
LAHVPGADADGDPALAAQAGVQVLDPLDSGPLSAASPRMYADSAALTRILLEAGRRADAESVVARLEGFAALHPDFPLLDCAAVHACGTCSPSSASVPGSNWPAVRRREGYRPNVVDPGDT